MTESKGRPGRQYCKKLVLAGLAVHGCAATVATGAEFAVGGGYVAEHSSNPRQLSEQDLAPGDEIESEWIHSLIVGGVYRDNGPDLAINLAGLVQMNHYQQGSEIDDDTRFAIDAAVLWTISPQRFTWTLEDHAAQTRESVFVSGAPDNMVTANIAETGPDVYLRITPTNTLDFGGRYGHLTFRNQEPNGNNERTTGFARWLYQQSVATTWSLNHEVTQVRYAEPGGTNLDYDQADSFLRFETRPAHSHVIVDYGSSNIDRDGGDKTSNTLARLTWTRDLTPLSTFSLVASREYGDAGRVLLSTVTTPGGSGPPVVNEVLTADLFYTRRGQAIYTYNGSDWAGNVEMFYRDYDYDASFNQNREERGGHAELSWNPGGLLSATVFGDSTKSKYLDIVRDDVDRVAGVRVRYRFARSLSAGLEASETRRDSTPDMPTSLDFVEKRVLLGLYYSTGPAFSPARR